MHAQRLWPAVRLPGRQPACQQHLSLAAGGALHAATLPASSQAKLRVAGGPREEHAQHQLAAGLTPRPALQSVLQAGGAKRMRTGPESAARLPGSAGLGAIVRNKSSLDASRWFFECLVLRSQVQGRARPAPPAWACAVQMACACGTGPARLPCSTLSSRWLKLLHAMSSRVLLLMLAGVQKICACTGPPMRNAGHNSVCRSRC